MTGSVFASDSMQWRMSPGGSIPMSRRSIPLPPPSSDTVTMAGQIFRVFFQPAQHGGKARAAADGDDMRSLCPQLTARKHRAHTQSSFPRRPQRTGAKDFSIFKAAPRNLASRSGEARRRNCAAMP